jgi:tight adherence protein C
MMLLILGLFVVFAGLALALLSTGVLTSERSGVARSLAAIETLGSLPDSTREQLEPSFGDRVLVPALQRLTRVGKRFTPKDRVERLTRRMELAGMPQEWTVDRVLAGKALGVIALSGLSVLFFLAVGQPMWALVFGIGGGVLGWFLPEIILYQLAYKRSQQIQRDLPDNLDLLTISVEAGMGFDAALGNVARNADGPLAEEFFRVLHEMQLGTGRMESLRALADRTDVEDLRVFINAMAQADAFGIPIANVLRAQAHEMRIKRQQRAEERAMQIPVKMIFPLIFFIMPTLMVIVIGPAVIRIYENFIQVV